MNNCRYAKEIDAIIVDSDAKTLVATAQAIAGDMIQKRQDGKMDERNSVTTSQIRNIYGTSKKIEMTLSAENVGRQYSRLILMKPKLAYVCGRFNRIRGLQVLRDCLSHAIDRIEGDYARMQNFFNFFEAILAYHKAEGGK